MAEKMTELLRVMTVYNLNWEVRIVKDGVMRVIGEILYIPDSGKYLALSGTRRCDDIDSIEKAEDWIVDTVRARG